MCSFIPLLYHSSCHYILSVFASLKLNSLLRKMQQFERCVDILSQSIPRNRLNVYTSF